MTLPTGFRYNALYAGIRKDPRPDLALIVSDVPAAAAGVFTTNRVQAAPLQLCRKHLEATHGTASAILVNAGNANCATKSGYLVAVETSRNAARALNVPASHVLPASTGVIGVELDPRKINRCIPKLVKGLAPGKFLDAADAILTTDTRRKVVTARYAGVGIAGMTKGSGMIHPRMATTLGFVMTDAIIPKSKMRAILEYAAERSYNRLSVDGDTSTNDTLVLLANGASKVEAPADFKRILADLMEQLAEQIARDGEGARKLIRIEVSGTRTEADAVRIGRAIANSPLVKTAIAGSDANWGRILSAAGACGVVFDPASAEIHLQDVLVCRRGLAAPFDEPALKKRLDDPECEIRFALGGDDKGSARFWTCDFTEDYIKINASYRT